jgi:hypothetical protein
MKIDSKDMLDLFHASRMTAEMAHLAYYVQENPSFQDWAIREVERLSLLIDTIKAKQAKEAA